MHRVQLSLNEQICQVYIHNIYFSLNIDFTGFNK